MLTFWPDQAGLAQRPAPLEIFAEDVKVNLKTHSSRFSGNVRVLFEPYQARCQSAEIFLDPRGQQVIKMVLQGEVTLQQGSSVLKAQRISLDVRSNQLQVSGKVYTRLQLERPLSLNLN
ncbi:MAG: hypothetical protein IGS03_14280 [Candidatus Sericytochromatia bacterium]|nr:hypothetical protein [Candidatus Sericytochromatia bacterium]